MNDLLIFSTQSQSISPMFSGPGGTWNFLDVHPRNSWILLGKSSGDIYYYNYLTNQLTNHVSLDLKHEITAVKFSNNGNLLAVGTKKGSVLILDSKSMALKTKEPFCLSKAGIRDLVFSPEDVYLASSDQDRCVSVYMLKEDGWSVLGKSRCHSKPINQLIFAYDQGKKDTHKFQPSFSKFKTVNKNTTKSIIYSHFLETGGTMVISVGKDRKLVEFDLSKSSFSQGLALKSRVSLEQEATPLCIGKEIGYQSMCQY